MFKERSTLYFPQQRHAPSTSLNPYAKVVRKAAQEVYARGKHARGGPVHDNVLQLYIYKPNNAVAAEKPARVFKYIYDFM